MRESQRVETAVEKSVLGGHRHHPCRGHRLQRATLASSPRLTGAYFGYEPDADGLDAETAAAVKGPASGEAAVPTPAPLPDQTSKEALSRVPPRALGPDGRFIPYWFRDRTDPGRILLTPLVQMDGLYYEGNRRRFLDPTEADKSMVTEPYDYEGQLMVEQTHPIVVDDTFRGVAGVDRALDRIGADLEAIKQAQALRGWHLEIFVISRGEERDGPRGPRVIASTLKAVDLRTKPVDETPHAALLSDFHAALTHDRVVTGTDPISGVSSLYAAARVPTGSWTVVTQMPRSDIIDRVQGPLVRTAALAAVGMAGVVGLMTWLSGAISGRIGRAVVASRRDRKSTV